MHTELKCNRCGVELDEEDVMEFGDETLCDDCFIDAKYKPRTCDPWAARAAQSASELEGVADLSENQQKIIDILGTKDEVFVDDLPIKLGLPEDVIQREFSVLVHLDLVTGRIDNGNIYIRLKK